MGIKELWTVLEPFSERRPLYELEGKKVAIDLSGWICDSQNVVEYNVQPHMFLRLIYYDIMHCLEYKYIKFFPPEIFSFVLVVC